MSWIRYAIFAVLLIFSSLSPVESAQNPDLTGTSIVINIPSRTLELYSGKNLIKQYPVAVGKPSTPTPLGRYSITSKEYNPAWYPPDGGQIVPSGPDNPLGYRWMAFLSTYGIHGTNAPWTIGYAVSNGCVRMQEADVEELFEIIRVGTPVTVTYDTVKVRVDEEKVSVAIYPDIYGYGGATLQEAKKRLNVHRLGGWISDQKLQEMIWEQSEEQAIISRFHKLKINGKTMVEPVISQQDTLYIPIKTVAAALNKEMVWDNSNSTVTVGTVTTGAVAKGGTIYVTTRELEKLFPAAMAVLDDKTVALNHHTVVLNGAPLSGEVRLKGTMAALPAATVAQAVGSSPVWDEGTQKLTISGTVVPVAMIDNRPYILITELYRHFKIYAYWDQQENRIDLTYPFIPVVAAY